MARIKRYRAHKPVAGYGTAVRVDPAAAAIVPAAAGQFGKALSTVGEPFLQARRVDELSQHTLRATKEFAELDAWAEQQPDFKTIEPEYKKQVAKLSAAHRKEIKDPAVWRMFYNDFQRLSIRGGIKAQGISRQREKDHNKANLITTLDEYADEVVNSTDFNATADVIKNATAAITGSAAANTITEVEAVTLQKKFQDTTQKNFIKREILDDPMAVYKRLTDEKTNHYPELDEAARTEMTKYSRDVAKAFLKERLNMVIKRRTLQEKELKDVQDKNAMAATIEALNGNMTDPQLVAMGKDRMIRREPMLAIMKIVDKVEDGEDDSGIKLLTRAEIAAGTATAAGILDRVNAGTLSKGTAGTLLEKMVTARDKNDISKRPEYKDAEGFIKNKMKTTGIMDKFDTSELPRIENALEEFDTRVRAGEDIRKVRDDIVTRYRPTAEKAAELPRPIFGSKQDLKEAYISTKNAYEMKKIDYATYHREVLNIKRLLDIYDRLGSEDEQTPTETSGKTKEKLKARKSRW